jgi:hypothetical protein
LYHARKSNGCLIARIKQPQIWGEYVNGNSITLQTQREAQKVSKNGALANKELAK